MSEPGWPSARLVYIGGVLLLAAVLCLTGLGSRDLWDPDETRYAAVAQTMMRTGEWIVPHLNGKIYGEKPPLSFWLMAACFKTFGANETAARLPSALAGILTAFIAFLFAERCFGPRGGFVAGVVAATAPALVQTSRWAVIDPLLVLCITAACYLLFLGTEGGRRRPYVFAGAGVAMGAGMLIKGPPAVLPVLVVLVYAALGRRFSAAANRWLVVSLVIAAAIMAAWIVPACLRGGSAYTQEILVHQTVGRYAQGWIHKKPAYYYLYVLPGLLMPWPLFIPGAIIRYWPKRNVTTSVAARGALFAMVWILVFGLFFSTSKSKKPLYVLPTLPAAAALVGGLMRGIENGREKPRERTVSDRWITAPIILTAAFVTALAAALPFAAHSYLRASIIRLTPLAMLAAALAIISFVSAYLAVKGRQVSAFALAVLALAGLNLTLSLAALEMLDARKSAKEFASGVGHISHTGRLATFGLRPQSFIFYGRHEVVPRLRTGEQAGEFLRSEKKSFLALPESKLSDLPRDVGVVVQRGRAWGRPAVLVANGPGLESRGIAP